MCGRYELHTHPAAIALAFGLGQAPALQPRYNIAPMQRVPIVRTNAGGERELVQVRWGLVPRWAKDPSIGARMINARAETAAARGAFRDALARRRCLVPADGFYEWQALPGGKQPMHVARRDGAPLGIAGLYERWLSPEGEVLDTCTILTTRANAPLRPLHERMPVILAPEDYARWLDRTHDDVTDLLVPLADDALRAHPVSTRVNAVRNDDAALIEPAAPGGAVPGRAPAIEATHAGPAAARHPGRPRQPDVPEALEPQLPLQPRLL